MIAVTDSSDGLVLRMFSSQSPKGPISAGFVTVEMLLSLVGLRWPFVPCLRFFAVDEPSCSGDGVEGLMDTGSCLARVG